MSSTLQPVDAYALVLEEVNGNRKLPVIIGSLEAKAIRIKMLNYKLPRPWTHDLFLSLTRELGVTLKKILIYKVEDGIYYSYLFFDNAGEEIRLIRVPRMQWHWRCDINALYIPLHKLWMKSICGKKVTVHSL